MKFVVLFSCAVGLLAVPTVATTLTKKQKLTWIFLTSGTGGTGFTKPELATMQTEHLGNFTRLFGRKKLVAAGPLSDPTKTKRGIVVLVSTNKKEVLESFKPDPFVQHQILKVEPTTIEVQFGAIGSTEISPDGIEENRLVIFTSKSPLNQEAKRQHELHLAEGRAAGLAFFATSTIKTADFYAVALFRGTNDAAISDWVNSYPLVKSGSLTAITMPQWLGKGFLGK